MGKHKICHNRCERPGVSVHRKRHLLTDSYMSRFVETNRKIRVNEVLCLKA
jgi:hypothetical protein